MTTGAKKFREILRSGEFIVSPGVYDGYTIRLVEDAGFKTACTSGAAISNALLGIADIGVMGLTENVNHCRNLARSVSIPLTADADNGYGNPVNVYHTVRMFEEAGVAGINIEDQVSPKRCGHFNGKQVIETSEMLGKIKAAVDARRDSGTLIMARTDAAAVHGFEAAIERAQAFEEAGADILFVEAVTRAEEVRALPQRLHAPQLMNMVIGGKTPLFNADALGQMGFGFVLYANAALQGAVAGMQKCLTVLRDAHQVDEDPAIVAPFLERQRLVNKDFWDGLEQKYK